MSPAQRGSLRGYHAWRYRCETNGGRCGDGNNSSRRGGLPLRVRGSWWTNEWGFYSQLGFLSPRVTWRQHASFFLLGNNRIWNWGADKTQRVRSNETVQFNASWLNFVSSTINDVLTGVEYLKFRPSNNSLLGHYIPQISRNEKNYVLANFCHVDILNRGIPGNLFPRAFCADRTRARYTRFGSGQWPEVVFETRP